MSGRADDGALLRQYLVGALPEEERLALAERYFSDDELFQRLASEETDLIDEYVAGELPAEESRLFERTLPTFPGRPERVRFARALREVAMEGGPSEEARAGRRADALPWLAAAAAILLASLAGLWALRVSLRQGELQAERNRLAARERQLESELAELRRAAAGSGTSLARAASFLLTPGLSREPAAGNRLRIPAGTEVVVLELPVAADPTHLYRVRIERADASELARREGLRPQRRTAGPALVVDFPASSLPDGDYVALVEDPAKVSSEPVEEFFFRVTR